MVLPHVPLGFDLQIHRLGRGDEKDFTLEVHLTEEVGNFSDLEFQILFWVRGVGDNVWAWDIRLVPMHSETVETKRFEIDLHIGKDLNSTIARTRAAGGEFMRGGFAKYSTRIRYFNLGIVHVPPATTAFDRLPSKGPPPYVSRSNSDRILHAQDSDVDTPGRFNLKKGSLRKRNTRTSNLDFVDVTPGPDGVTRSNSSPSPMPRASYEKPAVITRPPPWIFTKSGERDKYFYDRLRARMKEAQMLTRSQSKANSKRSSRRGGSITRYFSLKKPKTETVETSGGDRAVTETTTTNEALVTTPSRPYYYFRRFNKCVMKPFALDSCRSRVVVFGGPGSTSRKTSSRKVRRSASAPRTTFRSSGESAAVESQWEDYDDDDPDEEDLEREVGVGKFILVISKARPIAPKMNRNRSNSYRVTPPVQKVQQQALNDKLEQQALQNRLEQSRMEQENLKSRLEQEAVKTRLEHQALRNQIARDGVEDAMAEKELYYKQLKIKEEEEKLKRLKADNDRTLRERNLQIDYERTQLGQLLQKRRDEQDDMKKKPPVPAKLGGDGYSSRYGNGHRRGPSDTAIYMSQEYQDKRPMLDGSGDVGVGAPKLANNQSSTTPPRWDFTGVDLSTEPHDADEFDEGDEQLAKMRANIKRFDDMRNLQNPNNQRGRSYSVSDPKFTSSKGGYGAKGPVGQGFRGDGKGYGLPEE